jgi:predicted methyltransferase MtxX (methanogen marker protein 4)
LRRTLHLTHVSVLFDEYLDEIHLALVPLRLQRLLFRALAFLGRRRGYGSNLPEYARPARTYPLRADARFHRVPT